LRSGWISYKNPQYSSQRYNYYETCFSAHPVINVPESEQVMDPTFSNSDKVKVQLIFPLHLRRVGFTSVPLHHMLVLKSSSCSPGGEDGSKEGSGKTV